MLGPKIYHLVFLFVFRNNIFCFEKEKSAAAASSKTRVGNRNAYHDFLKIILWFVYLFVFLRILF